MIDKKRRKFSEIEKTFRCLRKMTICLTKTIRKKLQKRAREINEEDLELSKLERGIKWFESAVNYFIFFLILIWGIILSISLISIIISARKNWEIQTIELFERIVRLLSQSWVVLVILFLLLLYRPLRNFIERLRKIKIAGFVLDTLTPIPTPTPTQKKEQKKHSPKKTPSQKNKNQGGKQCLSSL